LTGSGDIAGNERTRTSEMIAGIDRFLLKELAESTARRESHWKRDLSSHSAYSDSVESNRMRLAHILGVRDARVALATSRRLVRNTDLEFLPLDEQKKNGYSIAQVSWPAFGDVTGEGLELRPAAAGLDAIVVVIPDAGQTPEQLAGLVPGVAPESQAARRLAESGFHVIVPALIDRTIVKNSRGRQLTGRELIHRPAYALGRHLIGYEVQKVLAIVDILSAANPDAAKHVGVFGYGEGGAIALYAAAHDTRLGAVCVSGYVDDRNDIWRQPLDRTVFGILEQFGDAQVAALVAPRTLIVEAAKGPEFVVPPGIASAPGRLTGPKLAAVKTEVEQARKLAAGLTPEPTIELVVSGPDGTGPFGTHGALEKFTRAIAPSAGLKPAQPALSVDPKVVLAAAVINRERQARQLHELDRHNQQLLNDSADVRREFMKKLDFSSLDAFTKSVEPYRDICAKEFIGRFDRELLPPNVRSRQIYDEPKFTGYEVVMDVFPDVIAYGILLLPRGIKDGEKRPVVVCQHGLGGLASHVADPKIDNRYYHRYAVRLTEEGFITFAPQALFTGQQFRTLYRKASPLKRTIYSVMVPQHQQITDWLKTLPQVEPARIGFYGLSYGGKAAMYIPPLVKNYCLSICSADFNERVWKNASSASPYSFVWDGGYDMYEFDEGSTFNYAELATLIAPRPFMVERGHFDGVGPDETVAYEFAKVFFLYDAKLGIGDRCAIEYFPGGHTINGKGTFAFLHRHLD
jgi:dienelactone hydrolase